MKIAVMIPMKAHSERVPNKSFRKLGRRLLSHWIVDTFNQLKAERELDIDIWANTDSDEIMDMYSKRRVKYYPRPLALRGDYTSMNNLIEDWMMRINPYDIYMQTHITNPFLSKQTIEKGLDMFMEQSGPIKQSVMGVTEHKERMYYNKQPVNFDYNNLIRTQDLTPVYEDNSCLYVFNKTIFSRNRNRVSEDPIHLPVPFPENIDIDTEDDMLIASLVAEGIFNEVEQPNTNPNNK